MDSILLLEEGFEIISTDASDKMLKYALKERWARRKEPAFDKWGRYCTQMASRPTYVCTYLLAYIPVVTK